MFTVYEGRSIQPAFDAAALTRATSGRYPVMHFIPAVGDKVPVTDEVMSRHILLTGATGSGKTNAIHQMLKQLIPSMTDDDVMVLFDAKGDFLRYYRPGKDVILSNGADATVFWNLFRETLVDGEDRFEENLLEIATALFETHIKRSNSPFFPQAAKDVFYGILTYIYLANKGSSPDVLNNEEIYYYLRDAGMEDVVQALGKYADLKGLVDYIYTESGGEQSQGVYSEIRLIAQELFRRNFRKKGDFSVRSFVRSKKGRILFLEYDLTTGRVLTPVYRCLIDLAIKEALSQEKPKGHVYFVIDEFKLLPDLQHIDDGVNFGRSRGARFIVAMQNINQMIEAYGRERAISMLSAFGTSIAFRVSDRDSVQFIQGRYGRNRKHYVLKSDTYGERSKEEFSYGEAVEDWDILGLHKGQAILSVADYSPDPILFQFKEEK